MEGVVRGGEMEESEGVVGWRRGGEVGRKQGWS